ncbi:MAG: carbamoyltransferase N-terminal domain-containing protein, partial [Bryobacteraceae bacterium]
MPFKKAHWPGLDEREYRISQGHDSAAALVCGGAVIAASAEERFNRQKHSAKFPVGSIRDCLKQAGLRIEDIDEIAHAFDYAPYRKAFSLDPEGAEIYDRVYSREALLEHLRRYLPEFPPERLHHVNHHLAHAASAYFTSGWDECLDIVIDGMGETQSASVFHAREGKLDKLHGMSAYDSIGIFYSLITLHLGFDFNSDEYKIMGLAPYGDAARYRSFFDEAVRLLPNGLIAIPALRVNRSKEDRERHLETRNYIERHLGPPRDPAADIADEHRDIAAALQERLDQAMLHICGHFGKQTGLKKLALSGGVALN